MDSPFHILKHTNLNFLEQPAFLNLNRSEFLFQFHGNPFPEVQFSQLPGYGYGYESARFFKIQDPDTANIRQVQKI